MEKYDEELISQWVDKDPELKTICGRTPGI